MGFRVAARASQLVDVKTRVGGPVAETQVLADGSFEGADSYLQYVNMPRLAALQALADASRDLLRHTAELPDSEQGLLDVLAEYRYAVYAFLAIAAGP